MADGREESGSGATSVGKGVIKGLFSVVIIVLLHFPMVCQCHGQRPSEDQPAPSLMAAAAFGQNKDVDAFARRPVPPVTMIFNSFCSHRGPQVGGGNVNEYLREQVCEPPIRNVPFLDERALQAWPNGSMAIRNGNSSTFSNEPFLQVPNNQQQLPCQPAYPPACSPACSPAFSPQLQTTAGAWSRPGAPASFSPGFDGTQRQHWNVPSAFGFGDGFHAPPTSAPQAVDASQATGDAHPIQSHETHMTDGLTPVQVAGVTSSEPTCPPEVDSAAAGNTAEEQSITPDFSSFVTSPALSYTSSSGTSTSCASPETVFVNSGSRPSGTAKFALKSVEELEKAISDVRALPEVQPYVASQPLSTRPRWRRSMQELRGKDQPAYFLLACRELGLDYPTILPLFRELFGANFGGNNQVGALRRIYSARSRGKKWKWMAKLLRDAKDLREA